MHHPSLRTFPSGTWSRPSVRRSASRSGVSAFAMLVVLASGALLVPSTVHAAPATYTVTHADDVDGACTAAHCSLRQALSAANKNPGRDTIRFNIPGQVPHTIRPTTELPTIKEPIVIDGTTEPSFSGTPVVELDGSRAPAGAVGLRISAGSSEVRGLVINRFGTRGSSTGGASGIVLERGGGNRIEGNFIGTDATGHARLGNRIAGIAIQRSSDNIIGGTTAATRNVLSGNGIGLGISGDGGVATRNRVIGNYIGVDAEGDNQLGNDTGVLISQAAGNAIGGLATAEANVISANAGAGIHFAGTGSRGNIVQGNLIGPDAAGTGSFGNFRGVFFTSGAWDTTVGGTLTGAANTIAFNRETGVLVDDNNLTRSTRVRILGNSIHSNGITPFPGLGIDLLPGGGVTLNDTGDGDVGANRKMNFPVLTSAIVNSATTISGTLNSEANLTYRLEFFATPTCDQSGYGEGKTYLGAQDIVTNASGNAGFVFTTMVPTVPGWFATGVSSEASFGNTSEFSKCREIDAPPDPASWVVNTVADESDSGGCTVSHCSLREAMLRANAVVGRDTIRFGIPDANDPPPFLLTPASPLPVLTEAVAIDGTTQPGYVDPPLVRIDGVTAGATAVGFDVRGGMTEIRGLSITRFGAAQIALASDDNVVAGNWLGVTPVVAAAQAAGTGIKVTGSRNRIGGTLTADRNLVATHEDFQIQLVGTSALDNVVAGNFVGTGPTGAAIVGAISYGGILAEAGADANLIGLNSAGGGNLIRGTANQGILIKDSSNTIIQNNSMDRDWGAFSENIWIRGGTGTLVGGDGPFDRNIIRGAGGMGVVVSAGSGHTIVGNEIYDNSEEPIDLGTTIDGVTANDVGDADSGPNGLQNYPVLTSAVRVGSVVEVLGTLNTRPSANYRIDFYVTYTGQPYCEGPDGDAADGSKVRYGEFEEWLGSKTVTTDAAGNADIAYTASPATDMQTAYIVATATAPDGSTSEGSWCKQVADSFVEAVGTQLAVAGDPWYLHGASTYHSSNRGGPNDDDEIIAMAGAGGLNTIRIGEMFDQINGLASAPYEESDWVEVDLYLEKLRRVDMRAILDLSAFRNHQVHRDIAAGGWTALCKDDGSVTPAERQTVDFASISPYRTSAYAEWDQFISFVANRVNTVNGVRYEDDPTIAVVSFAGEPNPPDSFLCGMPVDGTELTNFYAHVFAEWKEHDARHLLSNGGFIHLDWAELYGDADGSGIDWEAIFALPDNDVPTLHTYPARIDNGVPVDFQTPKVAAFMATLGKPWFTEEFGWRQDVGDATRASYYQWVYDRQTEYGSAGAAFWNLGVEVAGGTFDVSPATPETWQVVRSNAR